MRRHPFLQFLRYLAITVVLVTPAGAFTADLGLLATAMRLDGEHGRAGIHPAHHDKAPTSAPDRSL